MYKSNPQNPAEQELNLRERLVGAYASQARFFQARGNRRKTKAALEKLGHLEYTSLEDLRAQTEEQERFSSSLPTSTPASQSVQHKQPKASAKQSIPASKTINLNEALAKLENIVIEVEEDALDKSLTMRGLNT